MVDYGPLCIYSCQLLDEVSLVIISLTFFGHVWFYGRFLGYPSLVPGLLGVSGPSSLSLRTLDSSDTY